MTDIKDIKLAVIGGDLRMLYCASSLSARGFETCFCGFDHASADCGGAVRCGSVADALAGAGAVILPVPYTADGCRINCPFSRSEIRIDGLISQLRPSQLVFAGVCRPSLYDAAEAAGLTVTDYMKDEVLTVKNARATAEGALELCLRELPVTLLGLRVLVLGFGRVGFAVAELFKAAGCDVTVCARRAEQLARAQCSGFGACDFKRLCRVIPDADVVVNTVPNTVVDANVLSFVPKGTPVVDLASMPGGVDGDAAAHFGVRVIHALSLPGKTAPVSAGGYIADAICSALEMRGVV